MNKRIIAIQIILVTIAFNNFMQGNIIKGILLFLFLHLLIKVHNYQKEETEILNIYRSLNIRDKSTFLNFILDIGKEKKYLKGVLTTYGKKEKATK